MKPKEPADIATDDTVEETSASAGGNGAASAMLPPVYSADLIREETQVGRFYKFGITEGNEKLETIMQIVFTEVSSKSAFFEVTMVDDTGKQLGKPRAEVVTWAELESHGVFRKLDTTISTKTITTPAGEFECAVYEVKSGDDRSSTFYFAHDLPGAAVRVLHHKDGELFQWVELVEFRAE